MTRTSITTAIALLLSSCLYWQDNRIWDPDTATADAERDIAQHKVRFCYIGGRAPQPPGLPRTREAWETISRYPRIAVGPQGCIMNEHSDADGKYAVRYNQRMWQFLQTGH
jgi:hypothetical protein